MYEPRDTKDTGHARAQARLFTLPLYSASLLCLFTLPLYSCPVYHVTFFLAITLNLRTSTSATTPPSKSPAIWHALVRRGYFIVHPERNAYNCEG